MMCCESEFTEKVSVEEAFDAALILHYNISYRGPFGHESFLRKMFGRWEVRKTTPLDIINAFKQELKPYHVQEFNSMNGYTRGLTKILK